MGVTRIGFPACNASGASSNAPERAGMPAWLVVIVSAPLESIECVAVDGALRAAPSTHLSCAATWHTATSSTPTLLIACTGSSTVDDPVDDPVHPILESTDYEA
mmetsp:Transcript_36926/g.61198  ORF Transcript_36926/g.61198 Transcript_36926/m.61198 type:complete len:104 (+) Transcript_36926:1533-1844(+)